MIAIGKGYDVAFPPSVESKTFRIRKVLRCIPELFTCVYSILTGRAMGATRLNGLRQAAMCLSIHA